MPQKRSPNYEFAYHLNPDLDSSQIIEIRQTLERDLTNGGAIITFTKEPERIRLSYQIRHHANVLFGYLHFTLATPVNLEQFEAQIKLNPEIMRYLILNLPLETARKRRQAPQYRIKEKIEKKPVPKPSETETKEMEEQLEELIEKL